MGIKVNTKPFGEIEVDELQIIDFPEGILGFDFIKSFVILDPEDKTSPFKWMQAFEEKDLTFVIINPKDFMDNYKLKISPNDLEAVKAKSIYEVLNFAIVTIPDDPSEMTANLQGPIIINPVTRLGKQAISMNENYTVRHKIIREIKRHTGTGG